MPSSYGRFTGSCCCTAQRSSRAAFSASRPATRVADIVSCPSGWLVIKKPSDYVATLENSGSVLVDFARRRKLVKHDVEAAAKAVHGAVVDGRAAVRRGCIAGRMAGRNYRQFRCRLPGVAARGRGVHAHWPPAVFPGRRRRRVRCCRTSSLSPTSRARTRSRSAAATNGSCTRGSRTRRSSGTAIAAARWTHAWTRCARSCTSMALAASTTRARGSQRSPPGSRPNSMSRPRPSRAPRCCRSAI